MITFFGGNDLAIFTMIRCRNRWQFELIAFWKMSLSTTLALSALSTAVTLASERDALSALSTPVTGPPYDSLDTPVEYDPDFYLLKFQDSFWWIILYVLGLIIGMVGAMSLVKETWADIPKVRVVTYVFAGIIGVALLMVMITLILWWNRDELQGHHAPWSSVVNAVAVDGSATVVIVLGLMGIFYCDWSLAAVAGNMAGVPSSDVVVLYWLYFAFKRLPLASF
jgi:hypothetical protein